MREKRLRPSADLPHFSPPAPDTPLNCAPASRAAGLRRRNQAAEQGWRQEGASRWRPGPSMCTEFPGSSQSTFLGSSRPGCEVGRPALTIQFKKQKQRRFREAKRFAQDPPGASGGAALAARVGRSPIQWHLGRRAASSGLGCLKRKRRHIHCQCTQSPLQTT